MTVFVGRAVAGPRPLTMFMRAYAARLVLMVAYLLVFANLTYEPGDGLGGSLIVCFTLLTVLFRLPSIILFSSLMAFYAKIADPLVGGSYMTLLNTITNLGSMWTGQVGLRSIAAWDTMFECGDGGCGGMDGFAVVTVVSTLLGVVWFWLVRSRVDDLELSKLREWGTSSGARWR
jgi:PAT family acetyl-CoA transporter-like MFS transporter 1